MIARSNFKKGTYIRKRGKRGGVRQQLRRQLQNNHIPLPSIILANILSLRNKMDELSDPDAALDINGFGAPIRQDWDSEVTHKKQRRGVCVHKPMV